MATNPVFPRAAIRRTRPSTGSRAVLTEEATMEWHRRKGAGLLIRAVGLMMIALAYWSGAELRHRAVTDAMLDADALAYLLAGVIVVFGSLGVACAALGHHLFDRVEIAERWRRREP